MACTMFYNIATDPIGSKRLRIEVVQHHRSLYSSIIPTNQPQDSVALALEINIFYNEQTDNIREILRDGGKLGDISSRASEEEFES